MFSSGEWTNRFCSELWLQTCIAVFVVVVVVCLFLTFWLFQYNTSCDSVIWSVTSCNHLNCVLVLAVLCGGHFCVSCNFDLWGWTTSWTVRYSTHFKLEEQPLEQPFEQIVTQPISNWKNNHLKRSLLNPFQTARTTTWTDRYSTHFKLEEQPLEQFVSHFKFEEQQLEHFVTQPISNWKNKNLNSSLLHPFQTGSHTAGRQSNQPWNSQTEYHGQ